MKALYTFDLSDTMLYCADCYMKNNAVLVAPGASINKCAVPRSIFDRWQCGDVGGLWSCYLGRLWARRHDDAFEW